jgi:ribose transport system ATP-binding protein
MENIHKRFGPTRALQGVSLEVGPGEVHALVGENGAGKSTLMKILSGAERPDRGQMMLDGQAYHPSGPQEARRRGVAMIYQELALAPHLDVETNVMLGLERHTWGIVHRRMQRRRVEESLALLTHPEIRAQTPVYRLGPAGRQLVEVARALVSDARVIVLDEPTSSLTRADAEHLFALIGRLKARGVSIVFISHFLEEVQRVADRYTVLRDGTSVATGAIPGTPLGVILCAMVGRSLSELYPTVPHDLGPPVLEIKGLRGSPLPVEASLILHRGEILGIFGLVGAGRTEFLRTLFGLDPSSGGQVFLHERPQSTAFPGRRIEAGMGLLSEDRKQEGLALTQSIADNVTYSRLRPYARGGWLNLARRRAAVVSWLERLGVRCRGPGQKVNELSGGNQQKIAIARLLHQRADVLLLDEPTRGVDVGSKAETYRLIGTLAKEGKAIIMVSSYLPELRGICDQLAVMSRGRLSAARPVAAWTEEEIMACATGGVRA